MCDVVLVIPNNQGNRRGTGPSPVFERLGVAYLASILRKHRFSVEIIHVPLCGYTDEKTIEAISEMHPKILGFSMMFSQTELLGVINVGSKVKKILPGVHISVGGPAASVTDINLLESFSFIDSVVRGEGEHVLLEMTQRISSGNDWRETPGVSFRTGKRIAGSYEIVRNPGAGRITDLDDIPFPDRSFIEMQRSIPGKSMRSDMAVMSSSRGCYGNCNFCCVRTFYRNNDDRAGAWQGRSADNIIAEVAYLSKEKGVRHIVFIDDNFIGPGTQGKKRAREFARKLIDNKLDVGFEISCRSNDVENDVFLELKQAGLNGVFLGTESGVQRSLDFFNKNISVEQNLRAMKILSEIGIPFMCGMIVFEPFTTLNEILENIRFMRENKIAREFSMIFNKLQVHPNTSLEADLRDKGFDLRPVAEPGSSYIHKYDYSFIDRQTESIVGIVNMIAKEFMRRREAINRLQMTVVDKTDPEMELKHFFARAGSIMKNEADLGMRFVENACNYLLDNKIEFLNEEERSSLASEYFTKKDFEVFDGKSFDMALSNVLSKDSNISSMEWFTENLTVNTNNPKIFGSEEKRPVV